MTVAIPTNNQFHDITGRTFGWWLVLAYAGRKKGCHRWSCRCRCGSERILDGKNLKKGRWGSSCGCYWRTRLIGQRFSRYLVVGYAKRHGGRHFWYCRCDCGTEKVVNEKVLKNGEAKSCGCYRRDVTRKRNTTHGLSHTREYSVLCCLKRRERKQGLDAGWNIWMDQALREQQPACVLCGSAGKLTVDHVRPLSKGGGLYPGNAVILCQSCNSSKNDTHPDDLPDESRRKLLKSAKAFEKYWQGG